MYCCPERTPSPSLREGRGGVGLVYDAKGGDNDRRQRESVQSVYDCLNEETKFGMLNNS